jgi:hypothetical protein
MRKNKAELCSSEYEYSYPISSFKKYSPTCYKFCIVYTVNEAEK